MTGKQKEGHLAIQSKKRTRAMRKPNAAAPEGAGPFLILPAAPAACLSDLARKTI